MARRKTSKRFKAKTILRLPDLEQSKVAVLHSLASASSQESYGHAIDEFIGWYRSEPRLAFNRTVVLGYTPSNRGIGHDSAKVMKTCEAKSASVSERCWSSHQSRKRACHQRRSLEHEWTESLSAPVS